MSIDIDNRKVLIIGAGSTGLALAQGLKMKGIPFTVYDRDASPEARERNWSFGLHWGIEPLRGLVPAHIYAQLEAAQVDPHIDLDDPVTNRMPLHNGATGDLIMDIQFAKIYRLRRDKFRAMLLTDLADAEVQWGKELANITYSPDGAIVTATFTDGTSDTGAILIGADGAHSKTRTLLLGSEKAKVTPIGFASTMCFTRHTRERALFLRAPPHHPLYQAGPHPDGYSAWLGLQNGEDKDHPENWVFFQFISYPEPRDEINTRTDEELVRHVKDLARGFADPWRSAFEWMSDGTPVWYSKLRNWDPSLPGHRWENQRGRVTLAGDAAHPMTFQRGQGVNHAVLDAGRVCEALGAVWGGLTVEGREGAVKGFEEEMVRRSGEEVRASEANSVLLHDWSRLVGVRE
ncbi:FAD-dependent oxidoreductase [Aspergillus mulundensis]|uniref:FAD binding-containing protein n=1 Tax=Aspergillus mulundensis TaxID=1810919 RepID=A0A3D8QVL0_9EURO|nr:FAD binding-containing protein [Aspergillus mulundensis]RDW65893.1 FAD binding-containing protein [Aspergillus mulundensis]